MKDVNDNGWDLGEYLRDSEDDYPSMFSSLRTALKANSEVRRNRALQAALDSKVAKDLNKLEAHAKIRKAMQDAMDADALVQENSNRRREEASLRNAELTEEIRFNQLLDTVPAELQQSILEKEILKEKLLLARKQIRDVRTGKVPLEIGAKAAPAIKAKPADPESNSPVVEPAYTDRQIDALALKAVSRIGNMLPSDAEKELTDWLSQMARHLPRNVLREVESKIGEYRALMI